MKVVKKGPMANGTFEQKAEQVRSEQCSYVGEECQAEGTASTSP